MSAPSASVAAQRRRLLVWVPLLLVAFAVVLLSSPLSGVHLAGCVLAVVAAMGFVNEVGR